MGWPTGLQSENAQLGENLLLRQVQQILLVAKKLFCCAEVRRRAHKGVWECETENGNLRASPYAMAY
jgi:hypothetical protein